MYPLCIPAGDLDFVPGEMLDHGIALLDVRHGDIPADMQCLHTGLSVSLNGHRGVGQQ